MTVARNRCDDAVQSHLANPVVLGISDVEVALCVHRQRLAACDGTCGEIQLRHPGEAAIARGAASSRTGHCGDETIEVNLPDSIVEAVGDIEVSFIVE